MLWASILLPLVLVVALPTTQEKKDYHGYKALHISIPAGSTSLVNQLEDLAILLNPGGTELDLVVAPENLNRVMALAVDSTVISEDVGAAFDEEGGFGTYAVPNPSYFTSYKSYADHLQFLRDLQGSFTSNSALITAGGSVQGRNIEGIHIWGSGGRGSKPAVVFHGTIHAREWITTMTVEYIAYQLLTLYGSNAQVKTIVDNFDFYILPVTNPDGFVYSQTNDRLWRKNRQTVSGSTCIGRDNNRNWPYQWNANVQGGASTNPCAETFKGRAAADAPENQGLIAQLNSLRDSRGIRLYIDFHSYGQYILWAYGYSSSVKADNDAALRTLAETAQSAIRGSYGTAYTIGQSNPTLYPTTGTSVDWVDAVANATYSYTYELRDKGSYGFTLPANQIQPTAIETWQGVLAQLSRI